VDATQAADLTLALFSRAWSELGQDVGLALHLANVGEKEVSTEQAASRMPNRKFRVRDDLQVIGHDPEEYDAEEYDAEEYDAEEYDAEEYDVLG
jgi:hypothetical protein